MAKIYLSESKLETKKIGKELAKKVLNRFNKNKKAFIIGLKGNLGCGKTTFLQGFAKGLGIKEKILSPTFVILKRFNLPHGKEETFENFYHIDCYRIEKKENIFKTLGLRRIVGDKKNIVAMEWVDKVSEYLTENMICVEFKFKAGNQRIIKIIEKQS